MIFELGRCQIVRAKDIEFTDKVKPVNLDPFVSLTKNSEKIKPTRLLKCCYSSQQHFMIATLLSSSFMFKNW